MDEIAITKLNVESASYGQAGWIVAVIDGIAFDVPDFPGNRFRDAVSEWEAKGNEIGPYQPPNPALGDYTVTIAAMMDAKAKERRYDNALSIATYVGSSNAAWSAEAQAFVAWRDQIWAYCYAELDKVQAGEREQPTVSEFLTELETQFPLSWPE